MPGRGRVSVIRVKLNTPALVPRVKKLKPASVIFSKDGIRLSDQQAGFSDQLAAL